MAPSLQSIVLEPPSTIINYTISFKSYVTYAKGLSSLGMAQNPFGCIPISLSYYYIFVIFCFLFSFSRRDKGLTNWVGRSLVGTHEEFSVKLCEYYYIYSFSCKLSLCVRRTVHKCQYIKSIM